MAQDMWTVPEPPNWKPLLDVLELHGMKHILSQFMYIGQYQRPEGEPIEIYKHVLTRRCINIDQGLNTYAYRNETRTCPEACNKTSYQNIPVVEALRHVLV